MDGLGIIIGNGGILSDDIEHDNHRHYALFLMVVAVAKLHLTEPLISVKTSSAMKQKMSAECSAMTFNLMLFRREDLPK